MISLFKILFEIVVYSESILKILTGPSAMKEDHYILGAGGPLGQCSRKLISNPELRLWGRMITRCGPVVQLRSAIKAVG